MASFRKITSRILLIIVVVVPLAALAHFTIFPQQTRSILVRYSNLSRLSKLYFNSGTSKQKVDTLRLLIEQASLRVAGFWGQKTCDPTFIYCENEDDFKKFGSSYPVPAVTHLKLGSFIVLSNDAINLDIIAHEMSHAELYERIGFYNWSFKIPTWFDEGLAMQNDYRSYYSEDTLKIKSGNYKHLPDIEQLTTGKQFNNISYEQVMLNFMTARYVVNHWYSREKLIRLIKDICDGKNFDDAFKESKGK